MAHCTVTYSAEVVRRAVRSYFWRRFKTPLGLACLLALTLTAVCIGFVHASSAASGYVDAFGALVALTVVVQVSYYFSLPRAYTRRLSEQSFRTAELETTADGVRVSYGRNSAVLKWRRFKHIWFYPDFVILAVTPPFMHFTFLPTDGMTDDVRRELEAAAARPSG